MWLRWAILIALAYLVYRLLRPRNPKGGLQNRSSHGLREEELVKDPWCQTFLPKSQAISVQLGGKAVYFCSAECRDRFVESKNP